MTLLHELQDFGDLIAVTARDLRVDPGLVEKDYWIMHALWGLQRQGFQFELKGGTSLSKGFGLIHRFSEDIDIHIAPHAALPIGKNHTKAHHLDQRRAYYDGLATRIEIPGFAAPERDTAFDSANMMSGGVRLAYPALNPLPGGLKEGILLEAGFDQVAPNRQCDISSWAYAAAVHAGLKDITDNRALGVACYEPGYTLVEKLQTISTKHRQQQATGDMPRNFLRHYYDVHCLLDDARVQAFVGTEAYYAHKTTRFRGADDPDLTRNPAFWLPDAGVRARYEAEYLGTSGLYYRGQPPFADLLATVQAMAARL